MRNFSAGSRIIVSIILGGKKKEGFSGLILTALLLSFFVPRYNHALSLRVLVVL